MKCPICTDDMVKTRATNFGDEYDYCRTCKKELSEMHSMAGGKTDRDDDDAWLEDVMGGKPNKMSMDHAVGRMTGSQPQAQTLPRARAINPVVSQHPCMAFSPDRHSRDSFKDACYCGRIHYDSIAGHWLDRGPVQQGATASIPPVSIIAPLVSRYKCKSSIAVHKRLSSAATKCECGQIQLNTMTNYWEDVGTSTAKKAYPSKPTFKANLGSGKPCGTLGKYAEHYFPDGAQGTPCTCGTYAMPSQGATWASDTDGEPVPNGPSALLEPGERVINKQIQNAIAFGRLYGAGPSGLSRYLAELDHTRIAADYGKIELALFHEFGSEEYKKKNAPKK